MRQRLIVIFALSVFSAPPVYGQSDRDIDQRPKAASDAMDEEPLNLSVNDAEVVVDSLTSQPVLNIRLSPESTAAFAVFTSKNVGRQIVVSIDGTVIVKPTIMSPIPTGVIKISGEYELQKLQVWAAALKAKSSKIQVAQDT